jgi:Flp pilus assembly protein TadD
MHVVDDEVVVSRPVASSTYAAYLEARLALEAGRHADALRHVERALRFDPRDPHLWTTRAEIAARAGDEVTAWASAEHALSLRPGYPPARTLMAQLRGGPSSAALESTASDPADNGL